MTIAGTLQFVFDLLLGGGVLIVALKFARAPKDDPRLSRGLQMLQSKIAILEDLSDRTENQVRGLMALLDQKNIEVQQRIERANEQVRIVEGSIQSSMDVAKIFQDKIPHQEIIERQNTLKYLRAATFANQGQTLEQIAAQIDLPMGELEFIVKVNREQLTFTVEDLPAWAKAELAQTQTAADSYESETPNSAFAHPYTNDFNYLANSIDERTFAAESDRNYESSPDIAPLAALINEPVFEPTAEQSKQLSALRRTQSIIANLDRQFSMSGVEVQEDEIAPAATAPNFAPVLTPEPAPAFTAPRSMTPPSPAAQTIRKVVFPTIQSPKANQRFMSK